MRAKQMRRHTHSFITDSAVTNTLETWCKLFPWFTQKLSCALFVSEKVLICFNLALWGAPLFLPTQKCFHTFTPKSEQCKSLCNPFLSHVLCKHEYMTTRISFDLSSLKYIRHKLHTACMIDAQIIIAKGGNSTHVVCISSQHVGRTYYFTQL